MRIFAAVALGSISSLAAMGAHAAAAPKIAGIAFVGSDVTGQGSRARLPAGAKIYPPGAKITGSEGCPTTRFGTDGLIVAVIDYDGPPGAGSLAVVRQPASGGRFENAPYYLDLNGGRTLQYLGPIFDNGVYTLRLTTGHGQAQQPQTSATFTLARNCPPLR